MPSHSYMTSGLGQRYNCVGTSFREENKISLSDSHVWSLLSLLSNLWFLLAFSEILLCIRLNAIVVSLKVTFPFWLLWDLCTVCEGVLL